MNVLKVTLGLEMLKHEKKYLLLLDITCDWCYCICLRLSLYYGRIHVA